MKEIRFSKSNIKRKGKIFTFYYAGKNFEFPSHVKASAFVVATNDFLTKQVYRSLALLKEVNGIYFHYWGYFHPGKEQRFDHAKADHLCSYNIEVIKKQLDYAVERSHFANGPAIVDQKLKSIPDYFKEAIKQLQWVADKRSDTSFKFVFDDLYQRVFALENELNSYGAYECVSFAKKNPRHIKSKDKQPLKKVS